MIKLVLFIFIILPVVAYAEDIADIPVEIMADSLELKQKDGFAVFTGNVQVKYEEMRLGAELLEVHYASANIQEGESAEASSIQKIVAKEKVTIVYGGDTATGEIALFNLAENTIILEGNVVMVRQGNVLKGNKLVYNTVTKSMKLAGSSASKDDGLATKNSGSSGRVKASFSIPGGK